MPKLSHDHISGEDRRDSSFLQSPRSVAAALTSRRIFLDSRHASRRDGPFEFTFRLDDFGRNRYRNVQCIQLKAVGMPKVANEEYVIIDVLQARDSDIDSSVPVLNDGFAVSYFDNSSLSPGDVKMSDKCFSQRAVFDPPISSLDKFDVRILKHDGTLVTDADTANSNNVSLLFEITMSQP